MNDLMKLCSMISEKIKMKMLDPSIFPTLYHQRAVRQVVTQAFEVVDPCLTKMSQIGVLSFPMGFTFISVYGFDTA